MLSTSVALSALASMTVAQIPDTWPVCPARLLPYSSNWLPFQLLDSAMRRRQWRTGCMSNLPRAGQGGSYAAKH
jgi:hypothetical protein